MAIDLHTSNRVIGSYYDLSDWRQLEDNVNRMSRWQQDQLSDRLGLPHFDHPSRLLNALRWEAWNVVIAAIERVKGPYV